ncbi:MAG TPA: dihydropteroate synthase [Candidatus Binatus sp.]|nr:dihydropteroate synthase [Candidatus Binatus sp.]
MRTTRAGSSFTIVGENTHATRSLSRSGRHITELPDGRPAIRFEDAAGHERFLTLPPALRDGQDFAAGKVKHVRAAVLALLDDREPDASDARAYIEALARRQVAAGADWLDLNVDEVAPDGSTRVAAMVQLVRSVEGLAIAPPAIDSSDPAVIRAGVEASGDPSGLLLNSASLDRLEVLDLAASAGCAVVVAASGAAGLPKDAGQRVANAERIVAEATRRGIPDDHLHVDPLVMPVGVEPEAGRHFLDAVRRLRERFGPRVHLTGGLSNVSFGLPGRRRLNDVFIDLATEAGADAGIIDPVASDLGRIAARDRSSRPHRLAAYLLTGADPYGMAYLTAFRAGELEREERVLA